MKYAKLIDGCPIYAASCVLIESNYVYNPAEAQLLSSGYLPVIETVPPETDERHYAEPRWTEENGQIVQSWELAAVPDEVTPEEIAAAIEEALA